MPNINNHQITENCLSKVKSNTNILMKNKNLHDNNKINNHLLLYKCPSKPNISNKKYFILNRKKCLQKRKK